MTSLLHAIPAIRPPFLILAPICVQTGLAAAYFQGYSIAVDIAILCVIAALCGAIWVNALNEVQDFASGLDFLTKRTPFSGGSGLLVKAPYLERMVKSWVWLSGILTISIGIILCYLSTWLLLPLGGLGALIVLFYTNTLNRHPWLCLFAPGVGFGLLMTIGAYVASTGSYSLFSLAVGVVVFLPVCNLLLVNQIPDIEADKQIGRQHLAIAYGVDMAITVYAVSSIFSMILLLSLVLSGVLPALSSLVVIPMLVGGALVPKLIEFKQEIGNNPNAMVLAVVNANMTPLLLGLSLWFGDTQSIIYP
ncbi:UbiA prenyltransferase [Pseudoalteromonas luteoviolacea B = ATCC 29581]|nr:UbiA prenyltransferase [Pseudoalteromonas luteoviolacea B = ATCC 29581]